jgi:XTP/dITP diphosphohydrolase
MFDVKPKLLIATTNPGKLAELRGLLLTLPIELQGLADLSSYTEVVETGSTFSENASLKASGYAEQGQMATLADDSGLEIAALDGDPGVRSARYGGPDITFADKIHLLLKAMNSKPDHDRRARFVCSVAIADRDGHIVHTSDGVCNGKIAREARGDLGFGYDPIFVPDGFDQTFGELSNDVKQKISHRASAFARIIPFLRDNIAILT